MPMVFMNPGPSLIRSRKLPVILGTGYFQDITLAHTDQLVPITMKSGLKLLRGMKALIFQSRSVTGGLSSPPVGGTVLTYLPGASTGVGSSYTITSSLKTVDAAEEAAGGIVIPATPQNHGLLIIVFWNASTFTFSLSPMSGSAAPATSGFNRSPNTAQTTIAGVDMTATDLPALAIQTLARGGGGGTTQVNVVPPTGSSMVTLDGIGSASSHYVVGAASKYLKKGESLGVSGWTTPGAARLTTFSLLVQ